MFTDSQKVELGKPLDRNHVATRQQSGRALSYVESWHVIAEANRIFGFDGWASETVDLRVVAEHERKIGRAPNEKDGWGVSYLARVRVTVDGVVREGTGVGHGIDVDLGQAHESASKEAESDARKRALMTFGNPFGLALYDKTQANVAVTPPPGLSPDQCTEIDTLARDAGVTTAAICQAYGVDTLASIPADKFAAIRKRLNTTIDANTAAADQRKAA